MPFNIELLEVLHGLAVTAGDRNDVIQRYVELDIVLQSCQDIFVIHDCPHRQGLVQYGFDDHLLSRLSSKIAIRILLAHASELKSLKSSQDTGFPFNELRAVEIKSQGTCDFNSAYRIDDVH